MKLTNSTSLIAISALGILSMILPAIALGDRIKQYESPLFPLLRTSLESPSIYSFLFLFLSGFTVKLFSELASWKIGLLSMTLFPVAAICEMIADSSSHNMFPFEFIFYGFYSIPAIIGAYVGNSAKTK